MSVEFPEYFKVPAGPDYDDLIAGLQDDIEEEGGVRAFLGMIRSERSGSQSFDKSFLLPAGYHALSLEDGYTKEYTMDLPGMGPTKLISYIARDRNHLKANAIMSGMTFGHLMNESNYPEIHTQAIYHGIYVNKALMGDQVENFERAGGRNTLTGRRIAYRAMAGYMLGQLNNTSIQTVRTWADELIPNSDFRSDFMYGIGISLYAGWDDYTDMLVQDGRALEFGIDLIENVLPSDTP